MMDPLIDVLLLSLKKLRCGIADWEPAQRCTHHHVWRRHRAVAARLLSGFLQKAYAMGGNLADKFWCELEQNVMTGFRQTVRNLAAARSIPHSSVRLIKRSAFVSRERTTAILLSGVE
jgi:hypothetical protein